MNQADTIFAVSSGAGRAGIAVIRVSGPQSSVVIEALAGRLPSARKMALRELRSPVSCEFLDQAIVLWCPGPRSVTGEDVAEFHVHGGMAVVNAVCGALGSLSGCRLADAGEFTRRAFANGKIDLLEVEGLGDLLDARTEGQRKLATLQVLGQASAAVESWRVRLVELLACSDAALEFSEEDGVYDAASSRIFEEIAVLSSELSVAAELAGQAREMRDGVRVVLAGAPNTGKSSLLNALSRRPVAIVSDIAGTTRDVIEVQLDLGGVPVIVSDTAGLRSESYDVIEREGMARSRAVAADAEIVVWVAASDVVGSEAVDPAVVPSVLVWNKSDLPRVKLVRERNELGHTGWLELSVRTGSGLEEFVVVLSELVKARVKDVGRAVVWRDRQLGSLTESIRLLNDAQTRGMTGLEFVSADLRAAAVELGHITGRIDVEDWLDDIFSRFCIGK